MYKKGLITDGWFKYTRNPNYLGEMMIYSSFALATGRSEAFKVLAFNWSILFPVSLYLKEYSLRRKPGFDVYEK